MPVTFPGLNLEFNIPRVAFNILGKDIYWYGIIITLSIVIALVLMKKDKTKYNLSWEIITDFLCLALLIGFVFARVYYVVFNLDYYLSHPSEIFMVWRGGLAIFGGIIGATLTAVIFCKIKKISFLDLADFCVPYLALCQSLGRWGNFINREAYGYATTSFLRMGIWQGENYIYVHPTFLYESIITLFIFVLLKFAIKNRKFAGEKLYLYMMIYGVGRAFVESLRADALMIGDVKVSMIVGVLIAIFGATMILKNYIKYSKNVDRITS